MKTFNPIPEHPQRREGSLRSRILHLVRDSPGVSLRQITRATQIKGVTATVRRRTINDLLAERLIMRETTPTGGRPRTAFYPVE